jgi:hypothetical protein
MEEASNSVGDRDDRVKRPMQQEDDSTPEQNLEDAPDSLDDDGEMVEEKKSFMGMGRLWGGKKEDATEKVADAATAFDSPPQNDQN